MTGSPGDAALVNLTPVGAAAAGDGQLVSSDVTTVPNASNVNFGPGTVDPNVAIAPIGADGKVCYLNSSQTGVHLVADHLGTIALSAFTKATATGAPSRKVDTRTADLPGDAVQLVSRSGPGALSLDQITIRCYTYLVEGVGPTGTEDRWARFETWDVTGLVPDPLPEDDHREGSIVQIFRDLNDPPDFDVAQAGLYAYADNYGMLSNGSVVPFLYPDRARASRMFGIGRALHLLPDQPFTSDDAWGATEVLLNLPCTQGPPPCSGGWYLSDWTDNNRNGSPDSGDRVVCRYGESVIAEIMP